MSLKPLIVFGKYIFHLLEWVVGVKFSRQSLNTRNSFDAVMIVLATYFIFPIYSGYIDVFAQAVQGDFIGNYAVEGFRYSFIVSSVWLIIIALFSEVKFSILKFLTLVIPGLVLGIVLTFLLVQFVQYFQDLWKLDQVTLFVMTIYPLIFSYFVRSKITQSTKPKDRPHVPEVTQLQRSVYLE